MNRHRATRADRRAVARAASSPVTVTYADIFALVASMAVAVAYYGLLRYAS